MPGKIVVTGSTGNVGNTVVKQLTAKGALFKATFKDPAKAQRMQLQNVESVLLDYEQPETFDAAIKDTESLFLIPPPVNPRQHELLIPLVRAAVQAGVRRIVNLSAMNVERDDTLPLRQIEKYIETSGVDYVFLRPNWFMQNCNGFLLDSIKSGGIYLPTGDSKVSFIDIRDIAAVAVAVLTADDHLNQALTLTGGESMDHHEMAAVLSEINGKTIDYVSITEQDMAAGLKSEGWQDDAVEMGLKMFRSMRQGENEPVTSDVEKVLGRKPITFRQYVADYADCWK
jgi:uncharacterized protein YbjT (DUF2867 family)